jgi:Ca-activated chloride channel family protein
VVERYRLLGFENRAIADSDFRNDSVDAGEIGAGHSVTALYEVRLVDEASPADEALLVQVRYEDPESGEVLEIHRSMVRGDFGESFVEASPRFQLAAVVGEYAEILRGSFWAQGNTMAQLAVDARRIAEYMPADSQVQEFARLVTEAARLRE